MRRAILAIAGRFLFLFSVAGLFGGCASAPTYAPQPADGTPGYSDQQLGAGRYRVSFAGDIEESREQVENYLFRRAAEVTLAAGYTHFVVDKQNTEVKVSHRIVYETSDHPLGWGSQVSSPPYLRGWVRSNWQSHLILPREIGDVTRYIATSEIVMLSGEELTRNPNAISARDVLERAPHA